MTARKVASAVAVEEVPYVPSDFRGDEELDRAKALVEDLPLEKLKAKWDEIVADQKDLAIYKGLLSLELQRRVEEAHPGWTADDGGTRELAGDSLILKQSWSRDYDYIDTVIGELMGSGLLTNDEMNKLIPKWEPKVAGREYSSLLKRGGALAEILGRMRIVRARPEFEWRAR